MAIYKGLVVQRCYIHVEVEVDVDTPIDEISSIMQEEANPVKGSWESEAYDIELIGE